MCVTGYTLEYIPSGLAFLPTALSSLSHSKKLCNSSLSDINLEVLSNQEGTDESRLMLCSSGKVSWTLSDA